MPQPLIITKSREMTKSHLFYVRNVFVFLKSSQVSSVGPWTPGFSKHWLSYFVSAGSSSGCSRPPSCLQPSTTWTLLSKSWQEGTSEHCKHSLGSCRVRPAPPVLQAKMAALGGHLIHFRLLTVCLQNPQLQSPVRTQEYLGNLWILRSVN